MTNVDGIKELVIATIKNILSKDYDISAIGMDGEFHDDDVFGTTKFDFHCKAIMNAGKHRRFGYETELEGCLSCGCVIFDETTEILDSRFHIDED